MESQDEIRARIRDRLDEIGLGVRPASVSAGLGETTLRNFLAGMTRSMTAENLGKVARSIGVSAGWLIYGETAEIVQLWQAVPMERRAQALSILATFADETKVEEGK